MVLVFFPVGLIGMIMQRYIKNIAFSLMGVIAVLLVVATVVEKLCGTEVAVHWFYTASWTVALWALAVLFGGWYVIAAFRSGRMRWPVFGIHLAFVVILLGAMLTHTFGIEGAVPLRIGDSTCVYFTRDGAEKTLPFTVTLDDFRVQYYAGTATPEDYLSRISVRSADGTATAELSMNHIFRYRGWRFYQSSYDEDAGGCTLLLTRDPAGIAVTYSGYILLLVSMLLYLLVPKKACKVFKDFKVSKGVKSITGALLLLLPLSAAAAPKTLQRPVAETFGDLYVEYNGRICPMLVLANDVCTKLYGHNCYRDEDGTRYTAEQVLTGILFYYDDWAQVPLKQSRKPQQNREREMVFRMVAGGSLLKIWPSAHGWCDINSAGAADSVSHDEWNFRMYALQYVAYDLMQGRNIEANETLKKIRLYQQKYAGTDHLPTEAHFRAEQRWAAFPYTKPLAMVAVSLGLLFFLVRCIAQGRGKTLPRWWRILNTVCLAAIWLFLTAMLAWRWYVSGHIPLSNGHETMQSLAWFIMLLAIIGDIQYYLQISKFPNLQIGASNSQFGLLLASMPLLVSMMSASNPQITHLMPVLQSPLLSLHVSVIMLSYALLAFVMLNSVVALCGKAERQQRLMHFSRTLLRPAVCCLATGIFLGAVWANVSWGRYWGWDPKEVWALITLLVYAAPLHTQSLPFFRRPRVFHIYCLLAFLSVLFTYFGVNFLLGGLHAYA